MLCEFFLLFDSVVITTYDSVSVWLEPWVIFNDVENLSHIVVMERLGGFYMQTYYLFVKIANPLGVFSQSPRNSL